MVGKFFKFLTSRDNSSRSVVVDCLSKKLLFFRSECGPIVFGNEGFDWLADYLHEEVIQVDEIPSEMVRQRFSHLRFARPPHANNDDGLLVLRGTFYIKTRIDRERRRIT